MYGTVSHARQTVPGDLRARHSSKHQDPLPPTPRSPHQITRAGLAAPENRKRRSASRSCVQRSSTVPNRSCQPGCRAMVLVLCIGDLHLPHRAADLPAKFKSLLVPGKISHILCPGNLCTESAYDYLRSVCSDVTVTQGDFDESTKWPDTQVVSVGDFRVGVCHGHQVVPWGDHEALSILQRKLDCDILVTGHTHRFEAYRHEDRLVISTGSATGAYSAVTQHPTPSFALMDVDGSKATVYVYELMEGQVKVDKLEFVKPQQAQQQQQHGVRLRQL